MDTVPILPKPHINPLPPTHLRCELERAHLPNGRLFFPQLKAIGVLTSNKEGKVICEIDGCLLGGMQLGCCRCSFGVLVTVRAHFGNIDGRVPGGMQFGVLGAFLQG